MKFSLYTIHFAANVTLHLVACSRLSRILLTHGSSAVFRLAARTATQANDSMVERLHASIISVRGVNVKSNLIPCAVIFHIVDNIEMMTLGAIHLVQIEMVEKCLPIALTLVVATLERLLELLVEGERESDHVRMIAQNNFIARGCNELNYMYNNPTNHGDTP